MKKKIPFEFILDYLHPLEITIKPMFGCHAIYAHNKILLIVRKKDTHTDANGIWIATERKYHESLKKTIPFIQSVYILSNGKNETNWQMIHEDESDFETAALKLCEMIIKEDERIGRIPKRRPAPKGRKNEVHPSLLKIKLKSL